MLRKSLAAMAVVVLAATQVAAQEEERVWSDDRPDARAPMSITLGRMLEAGQVEAQYRFGRMTFEETILGSEVINFFDLLTVYNSAPLSRSTSDHVFTVGYGFTDAITFEVSGGWVEREQTLANEDVFVNYKIEGFSDIDASALLSVYDRDGVKAHLSASVIIPLGSIDKLGQDINGVDRLVGYDLQTGTGSLSVAPGFTAMIQNDKATVGAQVKYVNRLFANDRDYRHGDRVGAAMWAHYKMNDHFAVTSGVRLAKWGGITGEDPGMDPLADPDQDPYFSSGTRVDVPLGLWFRMPEGILAGTGWHVELLWPVHEVHDAPRMKGNWGVSIGVVKDVSGLRIPYITGNGDDDSNQP